MRYSWYRVPTLVRQRIISSRIGSRTFLHVCSSGPHRSSVALSVGHGERKMRINYSDKRTIKRLVSTFRDCFHLSQQAALRDFAILSGYRNHQEMVSSLSSQETRLVWRHEDFENLARKLPGYPIGRLMEFCCRYLSTWNKFPLLPPHLVDDILENPVDLIVVSGRAGAGRSYVMWELAEILHKKGLSVFIVGFSQNNEFREDWPWMGTDMIVARYNGAGPDLTPEANHSIAGAKQRQSVYLTTNHNHLRGVSSRLTGAPDIMDLFIEIDNPGAIAIKRYAVVSRYQGPSITQVGVTGHYGFLGRQETALIRAMSHGIILLSSVHGSRASQFEMAQEIFTLSRKSGVSCGYIRKASYKGDGDRHSLRPQDICVINDCQDPNNYEAIMMDGSLMHTLTSPTRGVLYVVGVDADTPEQAMAIWEALPFMRNRKKEMPTLLIHQDDEDIISRMTVSV